MEQGISLRKIFWSLSRSLLIFVISTILLLRWVDPKEKQIWEQTREISTEFDKAFGWFGAPMKVLLLAYAFFLVTGLRSSLRNLVNIVIKREEPKDSLQVRLRKFFRDYPKTANGFNMALPWIFALLLAYIILLLGYGIYQQFG